MPVDFVISGLSATETRCVAQLAAMYYASPEFRNEVRDTERDGAYEGCRTLGEYARALLRHRLRYLESL